jgi:hypothetical protein
MFFSFVKFWPVALWFSCMTWGCSSTSAPIPLTTEQASLAAQDNVDSAMDNLGSSLSFLAKSELLEDLFSMLPFTNQSGGDCIELDDGSSNFEEGCGSEEPGNPFDGLESEFDELGDDLAKFLDDYLFVESQLETEDGFVLIYKLDPELICGESAPGSEGDDGCTSFLTDYPIRVKIVSFNEGDLDISFLFGPEQYEGFLFELHKVELAAEFDFGSALTVVKEVMDVVNPDDPEATQWLPEILDGRIRLSLEDLELNTAQLKFSVIETIELKITADGETQIDLSISPSHWLIKADGTSEILTVEMDVGAVDVTVPGSFIGGSEVTCVSTAPPFEESGPENNEEICEESSAGLDGTISLHLGGLGINFDIQAGLDVWVLRNAGLGDTTTTLLHNATQLLGIDLNPTSGREIEVTLFENEVGNIALELIPELDVHVNLSFGDTIDTLGMPEWMANDLIKVTLDGANVPALEINEGGLAVVAGQLSVSSSAFPEDALIVQSGQCLVGEDEEEISEDAHPMLGNLSAGICDVE